MLQIMDLELSFGSQKIFDGAQTKIGHKERVGLVGRNGSGKTTLFKILSGEIEPDSGRIILSSGYTIGYLKQHLKFTKGTVQEEACLGLREDDRHNEWKAEKILSGLVFLKKIFIVIQQNFQEDIKFVLTLRRCSPVNPIFFSLMNLQTISILSLFDGLRGF